MAIKKLSAAKAVRENEINAERRYPDTIITDNGAVRVSELLRNKKNATITVHGQTIPVNKIPVTIYELDCGCKGKGIALDAGNVIFCETHLQKQVVVSARS